MSKLSDAYKAGYSRGMEDAQLRWIPCSKQLPEENKDVLCYTMCGLMMVASYGKLYPRSDMRGWITSTLCRFDYKNFVLAWMPLPEPWRNESDEEKNL